MIIKLLQDTDYADKADVIKQQGETNHYSTERTQRKEALEELGEGEVVNQFYVFRGEPEKPQVHTLLSNGVIEIHDIESGKLITILIARPGQIRRYYKACNMKQPDELVSIAYNNRKKNMNYL